MIDWEYSRTLKASYTRDNATMGFYQPEWRYEVVFAKMCMASGAMALRNFP
jgi:hypothetical protein